MAWSHQPELDCWIKWSHSLCVTGVASMTADQRRPKFTLCSRRTSVADHKTRHLSSSCKIDHINPLYFFGRGGGRDICSFSAASRFPWRRKFFVKVNWLGWMTFCSTFCFRGHRWHKKTRRRSPIWCGCWLDAVVRTWKKLGVYFPVYLRCT